MTTEEPDADGRRPDCGEHAIDFSRHPAPLLDRLRIGADLQARWLGTLSKRTHAFSATLPRPSTDAAKEA